MSELSVKDVFKAFKTAPWRNGGEFDAFLKTLPAEVDSRTLNDMLEILTQKRKDSEDWLYEMRLQIFKRVAARAADPALFGSLTKAIRVGDSKTRALAVALVPRCNNVREHPKLVALLKAPEPEVRQSAAAALKQIPGKSVLDALQAIIADKDFTDRGEAMDLIVPLAHHHAIPILKVVVEVGKNTDKQKALKYLADGRYMQKAMGVALRTILPAIEDKAESVAVQAAMSFAAMATEDDYWEFVGPLLDSSNVAMVKAAVTGLKYFHSPRTLLTLEKMLRKGPGVIRTEVLNAIEHIGNDDVLPILADALGHKQLQVRNQAGEVLSRLSQSRKVDVARTIIWLLNSRNVHVRRMAVEVARTIKDPDGELWPRLLVLLRDEDWWVRERVMDALVDMAGQQLTPHMVALLKDPHDIMRRFAVDVLIRLKDPSSLGALIQTAREDKDWWTKEKAVDAMAILADERAVSYIVDLMKRDKELELACITALRSLGNRSAAPYVAEMLQSEDPDVRVQAIECLGEFDASDCASKLQPLIADKHPRVARAAQQQLVRWNVALSEQFTVTRDKAVSFLDRMLMAMVEGEGDDLIICSDRHPYIKRVGQVIPLSQAVLSHDQVMAILTPHLSIAQVENLEKLVDADFSYEIKSNSARFRVNVFQAETGYGAVFRRINAALPDLEKLGLPEVVKGFGDKKWGLILVGGPTGSGKSTTLGAIINYINTTSDRHIISLEDPIEVVHESKKGLVNQRELGNHTNSFASALRATLREDPDVILVGEMRDYETITFAVNAAETGHLVFGTVHTVSADSSVDRVINAFPAKEQAQVRATLADNLQAVVCQHLLRRKDNNGRVVAMEVLLNNDAVSNLIRNGKTFQIPSVVATSRDVGMQSMDGELLRLYKEGVITAQDAYVKANSKRDFEEFIARENEERDIRVAAPARPATAT